MNGKIRIIVFIVLIIFFLGQTYDQFKYQGLVIDKGKLVYFNPIEYHYREMYRTPSEWKNYLVNDYDSYVKDGILFFCPDTPSPGVPKELLRYRIEIADSRYYNNQMTTNNRQPFQKYRYYLFYKQEGSTTFQVSKDNKEWEPLVVEFRSYKNLWRKDFIFTYLVKDYKCTLYFKCSFFEGLYDAFTFTHPPGS